MKVQLFHVPYVDGEGVQRHRVSAIVTDVDGGEESLEVLTNLCDALAKAETEPTVLAFRDVVEVSWL